MREVSSAAGGLAFFQIGLAAVGIPLVGDLATLGVMGSIQANGRDQEREADRIGLQLMAQAGYDTGQAYRVWENIIAEREADKDAEKPSLFLASHPPSAERRDTLKALAEKKSNGRQAAGTDGTETFRKATSSIRGMLLRDLVHLKKFDRSKWLVDSLIDDGVGAGELLFYKGEIYRLRADRKQKDLRNAVAAYKEAISTGDCPPRTYRSLGIVYSKQGKTDLSIDAYKKYLLAAPDAPDRLFIKSLIEPTS